MSSTKFKLGKSQGLGVAVIQYNTQPTSDWNCSDWVTWHKALVDAFMQGRFKSGIKYSREKAIELSNQVFRQWWEELAGFFSFNKSWCGYESLFYSYMSQVGLSDILTFLQSVLKPAANAVVTTAESASSVVENVAKAAKNTSSVVKYALPILGVGATIGVGWWAYNKYIK